MGKLEGKIALVTGGTTGIGFATARQFVNEGAYVFITGRREPELAAAVKEIGRNVAGYKAMFRIWLILIAFLPRSSGKRESSILCSRMPALLAMRL